MTRKGRDAVVILPLDEYESMKETLHLLSSPANARALFESMEQSRRGEHVEHELLE